MHEAVVEVVPQVRTFVSAWGTCLAAASYRTERFMDGTYGAW